MKITKIKYGYKVEHKGLERLCTKDKLGKVKKELYALNGTNPKEVNIYL